MPDEAGGAEDILHHLRDVARREALIDVILCQLDKAARTEEFTATVTTEKTVDDPPDKVPKGKGCCWHTRVSAEART